MKDIESLPTLRIRGVIAGRDEQSIYGESTSAADVIDFLDANKDATEIVVHISSNGGSVLEGKEIYTLLRNSGKKITTITQRALSVATLIMLAGHKRLIVEQGDFLLHSAGYDDLRGSFRLEDMQKLTHDLAIATEDMLNFYCRVLGEEKRMALVGAMAKDSNLGASEAIKLGFATGYYKKETVDASASQKGLLITAHYTELIKNQHTMSTVDKDVFSKFETKMNNAFKGMFKFIGKIKNQVSLKLASGEEVYVEPVSADAPDELKGGKVFIVDETGMPTTNAPADGEHALEDGRVIVVSGGVIADVKEAVDASKLQEEVAALKAQLAEKETALSAMAASKEAEVAAVKVEAKKHADEIQMAFNEFKKLVPGEPQGHKDEIEAPADMSKMSMAQRVRAMSKQRASLENQLK